MAFIVPDNLMVPLGARATRDTNQCADSWSDSVIESLRAELPIEFHAVPLCDLRARWINIRKKGTDGYRVKGKGPSKGSRKKTKRPAPPMWYRDYLQSEDWKSRRLVWLEHWEHRCSICNAHEDNVILDIHHRTYERLRHERLEDCIVVCRRCHVMIEEHIAIDKSTTTERSLF